MSNRIELRGSVTEVRGSALTARRGGELFTIRLRSIGSVLYTRVNRLPQSAQSIGVLLIVLPWGLYAFTPMHTVHVLTAVFSNIMGLGLIIGYHSILTWALDIESEDGNYIITGKKADLRTLRKRIDAYRTGHGMRRDVEEDRALDSDEDVYDRIDSSEDDGDVSMYDDIDACVRCGSTELGMASIAEGGIPGVFDVSGQVVCRNCGLVAPPLCFDRAEDHEAHVAALMEEGRIDREGEWIGDPDA